MAVRNTPEAQLEMGFNYLNGKNGYPEDDAKALTYFKAAADFNDAMGMCMVGEMHQYGFGTEKDYDEAFKWYKRSADKGCGRAAFRLGWLYANASVISSSIQYDEKMIGQYYRRAWELGYRDQAGILENYISKERFGNSKKAKSWKNVEDRQEIRWEFEKLYKDFFPAGYNMYFAMMASAMKSLGDTAEKSSSAFDNFLGLLDHPAYVENGAVKKVDSYDIEYNAFGGLIMKVAYGMLDGDLIYLLSKFNGDPIFNGKMRSIYEDHIYAACFSPPRSGEQNERNVTPVCEKTKLNARTRKRKSAAPAPIPSNERNATPIHQKAQSNEKTREKNSAPLTSTTDSASPSSYSSSSSPQKEEQNGDSGIVDYLILGAGGAMLGGPIGLGVGLWLAHKLGKK